MAIFPKFLILTNPKSKSKVQVQVQTDGWVFIKIRFSNHPLGKVSKKQDKAIYPEQKLC